MFSKLGQKVRSRHLYQRCIRVEYTHLSMKHVPICSVWNAGDSMRKVVTLAPRVNIDKAVTSSSSTQLQSNGDKAQILQA